MVCADKTTEPWDLRAISTNVEIPSLSICRLCGQSVTTVWLIIFKTLLTVTMETFGKILMNFGGNESLQTIWNWMQLCQLKINWACLIIPYINSFNRYSKCSIVIQTAANLLQRVSQITYSSREDDFVAFD